MRQDDADRPWAADRRPRGRRRSAAPRWVAIAGYAALGLGCLLAATVTFLLVAAPVDLVRDRAVELVKARTGRDLVIAGPTSLSWFPFGVAFSQVSLTAPADMGGSPVLTARSLQVELPFWSLLSRQVAVQRIVLDRPAVELRIDAQGRRSWDFADAPNRPTRLAQAGGRAVDAHPDDAPGDPRQARRHRHAGLLMAASVRIRDGSVRYVDERSGASHEVAGLDADLAAADAGRALQAKGSLAWKGETLAFDAGVSPAGAVLGGEPARLALRLAGRTFEANYEGSIGFDREPDLDGTLTIKAPSFAVLARAFGRQAAGSPGDAQADPLAVSAKVTAANRRVALSELSATLGDSSLSGALTIETGGTRPHVKGQLQLSELDFGRLLVRPGRAQPAGGGAGDAAGDPIGDLLQRKAAEPAKAPQVRGYTRRPGAKGWSDEIIDLSPLGLADAEVALSVDRLVYRNVATGRGRLALVVEDRVARITLEDVQLYDGRARGVLTLNGRGQIAVAEANLTMDAVSVLPLLSDALDFPWLDGRGRIALAVTGQGLSERQIVETLRGKVELSATNGAIIGVDAAKLLGRIEKGRFSGLRISPEDRTPFSELAGSFAIASGVAQNQDLRLHSPHLEVTGAGSANLGLRQVDYTVRPKIAAGAAGEGAAVNLAGLEVPVRIEGAWEKPTFTPDLKGVLGSPEAGQALKQIGKNLKSPEVREAIRGLLGGGDGQEKVKPRDLLEKLLKKD